MAGKFAIRFDPWYRPMSSAVFCPPSKSYVEVDGDDVHVRMAWAFNTRFPKSAVRSAQPTDMRTVSRGVHGWGGRWLVNGSGQGLVAITLEPEQKAKVLGVTTRLHELYVSVDDPAALIAELGAR